MSDATTTESRAQPAKSDRLLPWIAAERGVRALVLIVLGVVLLTHPHTNWAREIRELANDWGLNPSSNVVRKILDLVRKLLTFDPTQRITVREALNHPYFQLSIPDEP